MDRRIPPEQPPPAIPAVQRESVELKVRQGMHKDAFESALQRADHRRTMGTQDRVVSADMKQAQVVHAAQKRASQLPESRPQANASTMANAPMQQEQIESRQLEPDHVELLSEFVHSESHIREPVAQSPARQANTGSNRALSEESLAMLHRKLQSADCALGESIALELIDDPSGVMEIKLTKGLNNSWTIDLRVESEAALSESDETGLSENLMTHLRQNNILVDTVSVDSEHMTAQAGLLRTVDIPNGH